MDLMTILVDEDRSDVKGYKKRLIRWWQLLGRNGGKH